jgi:hypothetical protein
MDPHPRPWRLPREAPHVHVSLAGAGAPWHAATAHRAARPGQNSGTLALPPAVPVRTTHARRRGRPTVPPPLRVLGDKAVEVWNSLRVHHHQRRRHSPTPESPTGLTPNTVANSTTRRSVHRGIDLDWRLTSRAPDPVNLCDAKNYSD